MKRILMVLLCLCSLSGCANKYGQMELTIPDEIMGAMHVLLPRANIEIKESKKQLIVKNITGKSMDIFCSYAVFTPDSEKIQMMKWRQKLLPYKDLTFDIINDTTFYYYYIIDGGLDGKSDEDILFIGLYSYKKK